MLSIYSYSHNKRPLTFRIVDSAMGVGKSKCLMDHIRFSESCRLAGEENNRYIIFVPTISERDERYRQKLDVKTPEDKPYSQSIRDMIRDGDNIITTHALWSFFNDDTMLHKYCVLNHITMEYYQVDDGRFVKNPEGRYIETYPEGIGNLVILDDPRFNVDFSLSKNWYERAGKEKTRGKLKQLENCFRYAYEYMRSKGVRSNTFVYTVFNAYKDLIKSDGRHFPTAKRFLPCNTKATNDYSNCIGVAYLCNRFFDVTCTNFLAQRAKAEGNPELEFDNDNYALSELVQFIWRSHVRVKDSCQPVYVWVPDTRMRKLLQEFQKRAMEGKD